MPRAMAKENKQWRARLLDAFVSMESKKEMGDFLADLCTPAELAAFEERFEIARMLQDTERPYRDIAERTGASTTTVARVARFLRQENNKGYRLALQRIKK